jgi:hypothetical protein
MRTVKICIFMLLLVFVVPTGQAQQSAFQGSWIGEDHRSNHRLEITGVNWSHFVNNIIQGSGTARFFAGKAELLLANGDIYFNFTLLAPGLIQQPITMWDGLYRFRNAQNLPTIRINNSIGYSITQMYIFSSGTGWGNNILGETALHAGETISINFPHSFDFSKRYFIVLKDYKGDTYVKYIYFTLNCLIEFVLDDIDSNWGPIDGR